MLQITIEISNNNESADTSEKARCEAIRHFKDLVEYLESGAEVLESYRVRDINGNVLDDSYIVINCEDSSSDEDEEG